MNTLDPVLTTLASAMRLQFADDAPALRAIDRAVDHLASGLEREFDGIELRITSYSGRATGRMQVTDAVGCTCESKHRAWCWHRAAARLLMAQWAFAQPSMLRAKIVEQVSVADVADSYDMAGGFLDQPSSKWVDDLF